MENTIFTSLNGCIKTKIKLHDGCMIPIKNKDVVQSLCSCLRTGEIPMFNGEDFIIKNIFIVGDGICVNM